MIGILPDYLRPVIALAVLVIAIIAGGKLGLVTLIVKGYGFMTWVFILVFFIPILTIGLARVVRRDGVN